jgi:peroxiredoxin
VKSLKDEFDKRGVSVAVVSFAEPDNLARYQKQHQWPFLMLADPDRVAYRAFTLKRLSWFQVFSFSTLRFYLRMLGQRRQRQDWGKDDIYQGGGDFLLDRNGNVFFAHRGQDPADRPEVFELVRAVDRADKAAAS